MPEQSLQYKTSMYRVRPTITVDDKQNMTVVYDYFDETGKKVVAPDAQHMRADSQGGNGDFVGFVLWKKKPTDPPSDDLPPPEAGKPVYTATLYAAVAKTLGDPKKLPNFMVADENEELIIPIYKGTMRGVILIFQIFKDGRFIQLAASPDPEIGNSTNGG